MEKPAKPPAFSLVQPRTSGYGAARTRCRLSVRCVDHVMLVICPPRDDADEDEQQPESGILSEELGNFIPSVVDGERDTDGCRGAEYQLGYIGDQHGYQLSRLLRRQHHA